MESTDIRQIKAAIRDQAFLGNTRVNCAMGRVVAVRRRKGQLLAFIYGWGRWYRVESVHIECILVERRETRHPQHVSCAMMSLGTHVCSEEKAR